MLKTSARAAALLALGLMLQVAARGQVDMPDLTEMSGVPLPSPDLAVGTISVRVVRGDFSNNLVGETVEFTVDGRVETATTDAEGRAEITGLSTGARVRAAVVVDGERLESQDIVVGSSGIRVVLAATDPEAVARAAESARLAAAPAVDGFVVLGSETRIVADMRDDVLTVWYVLEILNSARVPVDIGGPFIVDLPRAARSTAVLEGSTPQATANGPRVTVTGPFAPGATRVEAAFQLPTSGPTARWTQTWPATLQQLTVLVQQSGGIDVNSPQFTSKQEMSDQGGVVIVGTGSTVAAGDAIELEITGLPYHPRWPRNVALSLAGAIVIAGIWAAAVARPKRVVS